VVAAWGPAVPLAVSPKDALARAGDCQKFLNDHPAAPDAELAGHYLAYLQTVARRDGLIPRKNGQKAKVRELLRAVWDDPLTSRLRSLTVQNRKYYISREPRKQGDVWLIDYYDDFERRETKPKFLGPNEQVAQESAPQCAIAGRVLDRLDGKEPWEEVMLGALGDLRDPSRLSKVPFEPVYQVYLMKRTVELAVEGSDLLERAQLRPWLEPVLPIANELPWRWMRGDDDAKPMRERAAALIRRLPPLTEVGRRLDELRRELDRGFSRHRAPVGWLAREGEDWQIRAASAMPEGRDLGVACPAPGAARRSAWGNLGKAEKGGRVRVTGGSETRLEGRLVFADRGAPVPAR
jgi:hypothetical protein